MKIAIVNKFFFLKGGQETVALEQMKLLEQQGHEVAFFSMHHPNNPTDYYWSKYFVQHADFSKGGSGHSALDKASMAVRFIHNNEAAEKFRAFLKEFKPDLIHCHGIAHQLTYSILPVAKAFRIPVVQTLHDYQVICPSYTLLKGDKTICETGCTPNNFAPCVSNRCVKDSMAASVLSAAEMFVNRSVNDYTRHVDMFISPSEFLAEKVVASGVKADRIMTIPNFLVGLDQFVPQYANQGYFLYVGRLSYEKGLRTLFEAFAKTPNATLRIAGDGPIKGDLLEFCKANGITNIEFLGHLNREQIEDAIKNATATILPSEWYENQPMSIIEAFSFGKPVIASNMGGMPEMVLDGHNGFLFPMGDADALAELVNKLSANPELVERLGKSARAWAIDRYHSDIHLSQLLTLYGKLTR